MTITVNPVNDGPVVDDSDLDLSAETVSEGESVRLTGSFSDPEGGTHAVTIDWGDGSQDTILLADGVTSFETADHTYAFSSQNDTASLESFTDKDYTGHRQVLGTLF